MVLIFSGHANASEVVRREVERAINRKMIILPTRIENVLPEGAMELALGNTHWLDAFTPPVERQLEKLAVSVKKLLDHDVEPPPGPEPAKPAAIAPAKWLIATTGALFGLIALAVGIITIVNGRKEAGGPSAPPSVSREPGSPSVDKPREPPSDNIAASAFVPLFNGKDLTGWKNGMPQNGSNWGVTIDGILEGHGGGENAGPGAPGSLLYDRRNFTNFVLRVTLRFRKGGGRIVIRHTGTDDDLCGYYIQAFGSGPFPIGRIGRLIALPPDMGEKTESTPFPDDRWKTIEISANKNQIITSMDGRGVLDSKVDSDATYTSGRIAVVCFWVAQIQIKDILIKELPHDADPKKSDRRRTPKT